MISQITTAAIGTETWAGMPARPRAAPTPTKSEMQMPKLAISTASGGEGRPADAVVLADQLGQALAGDDAHAGGEHLHERQREGDQDHHPQQAVAVLGADLRVGGDAAGVVAGVGGDQPRAEQRQQDRDTAAATLGCAAARDARAAQGGQAVAAGRGRPTGRGAGRPVLGPPSMCSLRVTTRECRRASTVSAAAHSSPSSPKRRRQPLGSITSSTSSTVMTPIICSGLVNHRGAGEVVVGHQPRDLLEVGFRDEPRGLVLDKLGQRRVGPRTHERPERDAALQSAVSVHHEDRGQQVLGHTARRGCARRPPPRSLGDTGR